MEWSPSEVHVTACVARGAVYTTTYITTQATCKMSAPTKKYLRYDRTEDASIWAAEDFQVLAKAALHTRGLIEEGSCQDLSACDSGIVWTPPRLQSAPPLLTLRIPLVLGPSVCITIRINSIPYASESTAYGARLTDTSDRWGGGGTHFRPHRCMRLYLPGTTRPPLKRAQNSPLEACNCKCMHAACMQFQRHHAS